MNRVDTAKAIISAMFPFAKCGIFSTPPVVGDKLTTIYEEDGLTICICYRWRYFKVWGLTREEFQQVEDYYSAIWKNYMTERYSVPQQSGECSSDNQERRADGSDSSAEQSSPWVGI